MGPRQLRPVCSSPDRALLPGTGGTTVRLTQHSVPCVSALTAGCWLLNRGEKGVERAGGEVRSAQGLELGAQQKPLICPRSSINSHTWCPE